MIRSIAVLALAMMTPIGVIMFFRCLMPLSLTGFWLSGDAVIEGQGILLAHGLFLLFWLIACVVVIILLVRMGKTPLGVWNRATSRGIDWSYWLSIMVVFMVYAVMRGDAPVFAEGGSDAVVFQYENDKERSYLVEVMLTGAMWILLPRVLLLRMGTIAKGAGFAGILLAAVYFGKKSGLVNLLSVLALLGIVGGFRHLGGRQVAKAGFAVLAGLIFVIVQYVRTSSHYGIDISPVQAAVTVGDLAYSSSTVYLDQFHRQSGIVLVDDYRLALGDVAPVRYWLNPFLRVITGEGIQASIGPYVFRSLYGGDAANGVNPTIFYEFVFVLGTGPITCVVAVLLPFGWMLLTLFLLRRMRGALVAMDPGQVSLLAYAVFALAYAMVDSLNAIRQSPVFFLLLLSWLTNARALPHGSAFLGPISLRGTARPVSRNAEVP